MFMPNNKDTLNFPYLTGVVAHIFKQQPREVLVLPMLMRLKWVNFVVFYPRYFFCFVKL